MKIFNWVHRRFHNNFSHNSSTFPLHKDEIAQKVKKVEPITDDADTKALLEQLALVDMFDGWKDGILTIGTLGFDSLKPFNYQRNDQCIIIDKEEEDGEEEQENYYVNDEEFDNDEEDESEVNPLVFTAFRNKFEDIGLNPDTENLQKPGIILNVDSINPLNITPFVGSPDRDLVHLTMDNVENDQRKKKGERTTLADLFSADSEPKRKPDPCEVKLQSCKKPTLRSKNGLSFAKKLIPRVGEDARLIKKLNQLMRRMMKRKIHPELEGKVYEMDGQMKPSSLGLLTSNALGANESVSLLQTQDAVV